MTQRHRKIVSNEKHVEKRVGKMQEQLDRAEAEGRPRVGAVGAPLGGPPREEP